MWQGNRIDYWIVCIGLKLHSSQYRRRREKGGILLQLFYNLCSRNKLKCSVLETRRSKLTHHLVLAMAPP